MASKDRAAQLAIALRRGEIKSEDVPDDLRKDVEALRSQDEDTLADMTKRGGEMRSEALKRALLESQRTRKAKDQGYIQRLFSPLTGR